MANVKKIGYFSADGQAKTGGTKRNSVLIILLGRDKRIRPELISASDNHPIEWRDEHLTPIMKTSFFWLFKGNIYEVAGEVIGTLTKDQISLLIYEEFDKERKYFERLKHQYETGEKDEIRARTRIPESVRIEVWRRDGGKCAICGSRESLEYDHIIPVSKGGGNTARNIELLCEKHNRSKGANIQ